MPPEPRALLVASSVTENGIVLARALMDTGFHVAGHCPPFHLFNQVRGLRTFRSGYGWLSSESSLCRTMRLWKPEILVPCDDSAVRLLHRVHQTAPPWGSLIEKSIGDPKGFFAAGSRVNFLSVMSSVKGVSVPEWSVARNEDDLPPRCDFPVVLKQENSSGGCGVRLVGSRGAVLSSYRELLSRPSPLGRVREFLEDGFFGVARHRRMNCTDVVVQRYVHGRPANRAVLCWKGAVLAGINVEVLRSCSETEPATVVQPIEHEEMDASAAAAVQLLGISGFCGFDFMLEQGSRRAWLLEMNPRLTSISHLSLGERKDLCAAFFGVCSGLPIPARPPLAKETLALFPREWVRNPASNNLIHQVDIPWDDAKLLAAWIRRSAKLDSYWRIRKAFMAIRGCVPQAFLRPVRSSQARLAIAEVKEDGPFH